MRQEIEGGGLDGSAPLGWARVIAPKIGRGTAVMRGCTVAAEALGPLEMGVSRHERNKQGVAFRQALSYSLKRWKRQRVSADAGQPLFELVHWIISCAGPANDFSAIRLHFKLDDASWARYRRHVDSLPRGATAISDFSPLLEESVEKGWLYASLQFGRQPASAVAICVRLCSRVRRFKEFRADGDFLEFRKVSADTLSDQLEKALPQPPARPVSKNGCQTPVGD